MDIVWDNVNIVLCFSHTYREGLFLFIKDIQNGITSSVLDVIVDGKGDTLDGVLQVWLRHS